MQTIGYGEIRGLVVRGGVPVFDPPPEVTREVKLGSRTDSRATVPEGDFALTKQVLDLFRELRILRNGTIEALEIQAGLPFRLRLRGQLADAASKHLRKEGPGR